MSKWAGFGQGLQQAGDIISKMFLMKDARERENEAIQRALAQQNTQNQFQFEQLGQTARNQEEMRAFQRSQHEDTMHQREVDNALEMSRNYPGAPLPAAQAHEWKQDSRAPLVVDIPGMTHAEMTSYDSPTSQVSFDQANRGVKGSPAAGMAQLAKMGGSDNFTGGETSYALRPSESESYRKEILRNTNRLQVQQLKDSFLNKKLAQDATLAAARNALTREQISSIEARAEAMLGYNYDSLDQRTAISNAQMAADIIEQEIRAEASRNRPNMMFNIPGMGAPPGAAAPPTPPRQAPVVAPSPRGGMTGGPAGAPPPASSGTGIGDALRRRQQQKSGGQ